MVTRVGALAGLAMFAWAPSVLSQAAAEPDGVAVGDWQIVPVLELRSRGEYRRDVDDRDRAVLLERARLGVDAANGPLEARIVFQDARTLDLASTDFVGGPPAVAQTGAREAWAEARTLSARAFVRLGRQPLTWGEGRLLGAAEWSPAGRSLDAVRGRLEFGDAAVEALAVALEDVANGTNGVSLDVAPYGELFGARAEYVFDPLVAAEVYALVRRAQSEPITPVPVRGETYTGSLRIHGEQADWTWGAEGAYQFGRVDDGARPGRGRFSGPRAAWAAAGHVAHTFDSWPLEPTFQLAVAYATGDRGKGTYRGFDPLLPDVHAWHGAMDLFAWSNEGEASARLAFVPLEQAVAAVEYRYARLAQPDAAWESAYLLPVGQSLANTSVALGHEVDTTWAWSPWAALRLEAAYSLLVLGNGARVLATAARGSSPAVSHYALAQASLAF